MKMMMMMMMMMMVMMMIMMMMTMMMSLMTVFSRMHATLPPALSVGRSVRPLVGPSRLAFFWRLRAVWGLLPLP